MRTACPQNYLRRRRIEESSMTRRPSATCLDPRRSETCGACIIESIIILYVLEYHYYYRCNRMRSIIDTLYYRYGQYGREGNCLDGIDFNTRYPYHDTFTCNILGARVHDAQRKVHIQNLSGLAPLGTVDWNYALDVFFLTQWQMRPAITLPHFSTFS